MLEPQLVLIFGDPYRCERALATRHAAILSECPDTERMVLFGDEIDIPSLRVTLLSASLFAQGRHFVIRHIETVAVPQPFAALLQQRLPAATFLTLLSGELKPSNPILKAMKDRGAVQPLPRLRGKGLERAAAEILAEFGLKLAPSALKKLVSQSGGDLLAISQEARKLRVFAPQGPLDEDTIARLSFAAGEGSIYPLLDRLGEGNLPATLAALSTLHEDPGRIFSALVRHLTHILMIRVLIDEGTKYTKMASLLGLPAWLVQRLAAQAKVHSTQPLIAALDRGIELDIAIKSGGIRPVDALLKLILSARTPASPAPG